MAKKFLKGVDIGGFCGLMGLMAIDINNADAESVVQTRPKVVGGAGQADDAAPVFVANSVEFIAYLQSVYPSAYGWTTKKGFLLVCPALIYGLFFYFAEWFAPQLYMAWLEFCLPLVEYVGGLTPRADKIAGQLVALGYPERADDARHGIAMARFMLFPLYIAWIVAFISALTNTPPVVISCSDQTRTKIWLRIFGYFLGSMAFFLTIEFFIDESAYQSVFFMPGQYHNGNIAIFMDILYAWMALTCLVLGFIRILTLRNVRYDIKNYNTANLK